MAKIKLDPNPTFSAPVSIPVHGGEPVAVSFTFRHRTRSAWEAWLKDELPGMEDADVIRALACGWELDDEFTRENIERLLENYGGANMAVFNAYERELSGARVKN
ncbi:phage tail assembly chaperone [Luteibacter sp. E-22]|uniref:phage tail assembly chaperone n=1 Tax=Luteibacter sp. E-22 TaxID=3404050 RepID=UPI003CED1510